MKDQMSKKPAPAPEPSTDTPNLTEAIVQLVAQFNASQQQIAETLEALQANQPKRELDYAEYLERNPIPRLKKPAYQNAYPVNPRGLSEATINKLAELKPGRYLNGIVTVTEGDDLDKTTYIHYKVKTVADRMNNKSFFSSFSDLVEKIWNEQQARSTS